MYSLYERMVESTQVSLHLCPGLGMKCVAGEEKG